MNNLGEKMKLEKLIVMDDVLGMADKSNEFGRKFIESCIQATVTFTFFM